MTDVGTGYGEGQIEQPAAIQGQLFDGLLLHDFAEAGVIGFQHFGETYDFDLFLRQTEHQRHIQDHLLPHLETHAASERREANGLHLQFVFTRRETRKIIGPLRAGDGVADSAGGNELHLHTGQLNRPLLRVFDIAAQAGEIALRLKAQTKKEAD